MAVGGHCARNCIFEDEMRVIRRSRALWARAVDIDLA
jgi:hypothetical protein